MRKSMVTRTFKATTANISVVDVNTKSVSDKNITLARSYKNEHDIQKAIVKGGLLPENEKLVCINSFDTAFTKYAMTEEAFIANATPIIEDGKE